ncbi:unnamed protein product [Phytophthora lilii]|uniref:Unnamed protein product n=1 Tax=Phytophthora lilii TaxID=2077276 RepID=A0A9W6XMU5_9STRA|nr:unnamed protein product [Phytophthora lilii]
MLADLDPEGDSLTAAARKRMTPAHYAALYGSAREVETLLLCLTRVFGDLEELVELGAANPLNVADQSGMTSLYIAGRAIVSHAGETGGNIDESEVAAVNDSLDIRDAKVQLLLDHGGRLFAPGFLVRAFAASSSRPPHVILPRPVQCCLQMWLIEDRSRQEQPEDEEIAADSDDTSKQSLTELCVQWIACVTCLGPSATLLAAVACAGYAQEVFPALLDLPLRRPDCPALLHRLHKFAEHGRNEHPLLLQLHDELFEAWQELPGYV